MAVRDYPGRVPLDDLPPPRAGGAGRDARQGEASPRADTGHRNRVNLIVTECGAPDPQKSTGRTRLCPARPRSAGFGVA